MAKTNPAVELAKQLADIAMEFTSNPDDVDVRKILQTRFYLKIDGTIIDQPARRDNAEECLGDPGYRAIIATARAGGGVSDG